LSQQYQHEDDYCEAEAGAGTQTAIHDDHTRTILVRNDSPDVTFRWSLNPYRGCAHGCIYCYARPTHEYLDLSAGLDFETQLFVKREAAQLLRRELARASWQPEVIGLSGVTDCYQPLERELQLTRQCLEVLAEFRNPVQIVTKSRLITRDIDLLVELAAHQAVAVAISLTTLDAALARRMEPRASAPHARLATIRQLASAGIPVGAMIAPVIPGLTEHELPALLASAREAGAAFASYTLLRLPFGVKELFADWLDRNYPQRKQRVLRRIRQVRGGRLNDARFGFRMKGQGLWAELIQQTFTLHHRRLGFSSSPVLSTAAFRRPVRQQRGLFDDLLKES
jgi:DNA repair photolyase